MINARSSTMGRWIRPLIILIVLVGIGFGIVWLWNYKTNFPVPSHRSDSDFTSVLLHQHPELFTKGNQPIFTITKVEKPQDNWYVLHLKLKAGTGPESMVVINDPYFDTSYMHVITGPESSFSVKELSNAFVPDATAHAIMNEEGSK